VCVYVCVDNLVDASCVRPELGWLLSILLDITPKHNDLSVRSLNPAYQLP